MSKITRSETPEKMPGRRADKAPARSSASEISNFLRTAKRMNPDQAGNLVFSLDATMSRQPTWDRACQLQASMFNAVARIGGLNVQLVYFRGFGECRASRWVMDSTALRDLMTGIECRGGQTQLGKVLAHVRRESEKRKIAALVFIGDAMEEDIDLICQRAGELGLRGIRAFLFQEGGDPVASRAFHEIARLTGGACFQLGPDSANELAALLGAIAVYASGGRKALEHSGSRASRLLIGKMDRPGPNRG